MSRFAPLCTLALIVALAPAIAPAATTADVHVIGAPSRGRPKPPQTRPTPHTDALIRDLTSLQSALYSTQARLSRMEKAIEKARNSAQDVSKMIKSIRKVEDKLYRIEKQLRTLSKIPNLGKLQPLVWNLERVRKQVHTIRVKAEKADRNIVRPTITKLKAAERKAEQMVAKFRQMTSDTRMAVAAVTRLRAFVVSRGSRHAEVRALESVSRPTRSTVGQVRSGLSQINSSTGSIERKFNALARTLSSVASAKSAVAKLDRDMKPFDKIARDVNKVLSKRVKINLGFKKFSFSVRDVLEKPGKIFKKALKPLQKLARKAIEPVMRKLKLEIRPPKALTALPNRLNSIRMDNTLSRSVDNLQRQVESQAFAAYQRALTKLMSTQTSDLAR